MKLTLFWSETAKISYYEIIEFISKRWGQKIIVRFDQQVQEQLTLIQKHPYLWKESEKIRLARKCQINPLITLYYRINDQRVELLLFWDNRKNPSEFPL